MSQRYLVPAVCRAFELIEMIGRESGGMSISQIHRRLGMPLSSAAGLVYTLEHLGYLDRGDSLRYTASARLRGLAGSPQDDLVARCHPLLEQLARETNFTAHLAVLRGCESIYVDKVQASSVLQVSTYVGMAWPLHTSAVGKVLLAFQPDAGRRLRELRLKKLTRQTIASKRALEKQLERFRGLGYGWERNEGELGLGCVAAPVFGPAGGVIAGVSITGSALRLADSTIPALGALVSAYAKRMSVAQAFLPAQTRRNRRFAVSAGRNSCATPGTI